MEFKGTKVFPIYYGGDNYSVDLIFDNGSTISIDRRDRYSDNMSCERLEMEANALLISKAPEMLEMLIELRDNCDGNNFSSFREKLEYLIKQATDVR